MNKNKILSWYGGKYRIAKDIIQHFPEHKIYCEVFGGAAHVLFQKHPSQVEVYNDINFDLVNLFKVLRDKEKLEKLVEQLKYTPVARSEYIFCRDNYKNAADEIERARRFYTKIMQSYAGKQDSWGFVINSTNNNMASTCNRWINNIKELKSAIERFRRVQIENMDFEDCIKRFDTIDTLFYLDPPYVTHMRVDKNVYEHEMADIDHERLIDILKSVKGKFILSGYDNTLYNNNFEKIFIKTIQKLPSKKRTLAEEFIWVNFKSKYKQVSIWS